MKSRITVGTLVYLAVLQLVHSQYIRNFPEAILPNQLLFSPNVIDYPLDILPNGQILPGGQIFPSGQILSGGQIFPGGQIIQNILPGPILPNMLPNQVIPSVLPSQVLPGPCLPPVLPGPVLPPVLPANIAPTTIIQDSSVANNLANALQLLVVSNLLANKLPTNDIVVPNFEVLPPMGPCLNGYNYVY